LSKKDDDYMPEVSAPAATPCRVIVVDDHPLLRAALGSLVAEHSGLEVAAEAANGREALESCRRVKPELVLMDVSMPGMDGLEATRTIKRELPRTIVLVLSTYGDPDLLAEALEAGAAGYILKTATPQKIVGAIQGALNGESPLDQGLATGLNLRLIEEARKDGRSPLDPGGSPDGNGVALPLPASLTRREVEVLRLVARGHTNTQIARSLLVSVSTTKKHVQRIMSKLEVSTRTQAAVKASYLGLLNNRELNNREER
jgi:DNA-binding NarL/FixJ family response regulator